MNVLTHPVGSFESPRELPYVDLPSPAEFHPLSGLGASKYRAPIDRGIPLEALLLNQGSETLLVSLHGSTDRSRFELPRFEWYRTLRGQSHSTFYLSDPTIRLGDRFQLGWYTGWGELDLFPLLAEWATRAANAVGAKHIVFFGSSGGGFAAMQLATFAPGSLAVAFNPQTHIASYTQRNDPLHPQRSYVRHAMPHLEPEEGLSLDHDWSTPLGERASLLRRYEKVQQNRVLFAQNSRDLSHWNAHYLPFRETVEAGPNAQSVRWLEYMGPEGHHPPSRGRLADTLAAGISWLHEDGGPSA